MAGCRCDCPV